MTTETQYQGNPWVKFITQYGPSAKNEAAFDEHIISAAARYKVRPPEISSPVLEELITLMSSKNPESVILTGTPGDGKTYLCRQVFYRLGGNDKDWDKRIPKIKLPQGRKLVIIKDFTALGHKGQFNVLTGLSDAVFGQSSEEIYLIAANEGILTDQVTLRNEKKEYVDQYQKKLEPLADLIEELLNRQEQRIAQSGRLTIFDLSRTSAAQMALKILDELLESSKWDVCNTCLGSKSEDPKIRCVIHENRKRFLDSTIRERFHALLELCDLNGYHLSIRQLLLLIANALTGHCEVDNASKLVDCKDIPAVAASARPISGAYFQNIFGLNLSSRQRYSKEPFAVLNSIGIGEETSNKFDTLLVFGDQEQRYSKDHQEVVLSDHYFFDIKTHSAKRERYLSGDANDPEEFLQDLAALRRRLFFELPKSLERTYGLFDLTVYHFGGQFRDQILNRLRSGRAIPTRFLDEIIRGLNRIFIGALIDDKQTLYLATSGTDSQAKISRVISYTIPNDPNMPALHLSLKRGLVELIPEVLLEVHYLGNPLVGMRLNLTRYEFICRVARGALPSSFSSECYEDFLNFKSQLIAIMKNKFASAEHSNQLKFVTISKEGQILQHELEVTEGKVYGNR